MMSVSWAVLGAHASPFDYTVCVTVAPDYTDAGWGDHWTDDSERPARGFRYEVRESGAPAIVVHEGFLEDSGPDAGCATVLLQPEDYELYVESTATLDGDLEVLAWNVEPGSLTGQLPGHASAVFPFHPLGAGTATLGPLDGAADVRWNHLVLVTGALTRQNAGLSVETFNVVAQKCWRPAEHAACNGVDPCQAGYCAREDPPAGTSSLAPYSPLGDKIMLGGVRRKFTILHELGHLVFQKADANGTDPGGFATGGAVPDTNNCDGTGGGDGLIVKDYLGKAFHEAVAHFYAASSMNDLSLGGQEDCEFQVTHELDWDEDGLFPIGPNDPVLPCIGDPYDSDGADPSIKDWLYDMVDQTDGGLDGECVGPLEGYTTEYDVLRFLWSLPTLYSVSMADLFVVFDLADPHDWDPEGEDGLDGPIGRLLDAAATVCDGSDCLDVEFELAAEWHGVLRD